MTLASLLLAGAVTCAACDDTPTATPPPPQTLQETLPGSGIRAEANARPPVEAPVLAPDAILDPVALYATNCAGCHGANGEGGVARGLGDPVYLAIADQATLRRIASNGVPGTPMPAFARSAGGMLTDPQIDAIVRSLRQRWAKPGALNGLTPPPYDASAPLTRHATRDAAGNAPNAAAADDATSRAARDAAGNATSSATGDAGGDPVRGLVAYGRACASCHGGDGRGATRAGSIVDPAYLSLVSDQGLRTTIIAGRPDLGHPDWRGVAASGHAAIRNPSGATAALDTDSKDAYALAPAAPRDAPMSAQDVSDITAWIASQRTPLETRRSTP